MLETWRLMPSSVSSGKNSLAWCRVIALAMRPRRAAACVTGERQHALADVGVVVLLVRVGVVPVVLVDPPPDAQAADQVAGEQTDEGVAGARAADLLVPAVVAEEGDLGRGDPEQGGRDQHEPGRADGHGEPPACGEEPEGQDGADDVAHRSAVEQLGRPDGAAEGGVIAAPRSGHDRRHDMLLRVGSGPKDASNELQDGTFRACRDRLRSENQRTLTYRITTRPGPSSLT